MGSKKKKEELNEAYKPVIEYLEVLLKGKIQKVIVSDLLTDSPAALVQGAYGMSPTMQRYMKAQAVASGSDESQLGNMNQAVMEINPGHPIVQKLDGLVKGGDKESEELADFSYLVYDVAAMTSGYSIEDPRSFAKRVMGLMNDSAAAADSGPQDAEIVEEKEEEKKEDDDKGDDDVKEVKAEI